MKRKERVKGVEKREREIGMGKYSSSWMDACFLPRSLMSNCFFVFDLLFKLGRLIAYYFPAYYTHLDILTSFHIDYEHDSAVFERVFNHASS